MRAVFPAPLGPVTTTTSIDGGAELNAAVAMVAWVKVGRPVGRSVGHRSRGQVRAVLASYAPKIATSALAEIDGSRRRKPPGSTAATGRSRATILLAKLPRGFT